MAVALNALFLPGGVLDSIVLGRCEETNFIAIYASINDCQITVKKQLLIECLVLIAIAVFITCGVVWMAFNYVKEMEKLKKSKIHK